MLNQRADGSVAAQPDGHHQPPIPAEFSSAQASAAANSSSASAKHKGTPALGLHGFFEELGCPHCILSEAKIRLIWPLRDLGVKKLQQSSPLQTMFTTGYSLL